MKRLTTALLLLGWAEAQLLREEAHDPRLAEDQRARREHGPEDDLSEVMRSETVALELAMPEQQLRDPEDDERCQHHEGYATQPIARP